MTLSLPNSSKLYSFLEFSIYFLCYHKTYLNWTLHWLWIMLGRYFWVFPQVSCDREETLKLCNFRNNRWVCLPELWSWIFFSAKWAHTWLLVDNPWCMKIWSIWFRGISVRESWSRTGLKANSSDGVSCRKSFWSSNCFKEVTEYDLRLIRADLTIKVAIFSHPFSYAWLMKCDIVELVLYKICNLFFVLIIWRSMIISRKLKFYLFDSLISNHRLNLR